MRSKGRMRNIWNGLPQTRLRTFALLLFFCLTAISHLGRALRNVNIWLSLLLHLPEHRGEQCGPDCSSRSRLNVRPAMTRCYDAIDLLEMTVAQTSKMCGSCGKRAAKFSSQFIACSCLATCGPLNIFRIIRCSYSFEYFQQRRFKLQLFNRNVIVGHWLLSRCKQQISSSARTSSGSSTLWVWHNLMCSVSW